jgi:hypothetical protein
MGAAKTRYEVRIETVVSPATLAAFHVPLRQTPMPRRTVYRFSIPADRDLSEVVQRLTERDVELLEIRRRPDSGSRTGTATPPGPDAGADVIVPFRTATDVVPSGAEAGSPEPGRPDAEGHCSAG